MRRTGIKFLLALIDLLGHVDVLQHVGWVER